MKEQTKLGYQYYLILFDKIDPRYRNIWSIFADQTDQMFRRAVFYDALKQDIPLNQALNKARKSMLDYGAMSATEKGFFNKITMFYSFARQIKLEFLNSLAKMISTDNYKGLVQLTKFQMKQHKLVGDSLYESDQDKSRLFKIYKGKVDGYDLYSYGYGNPFVESFEGIINIGNLLIKPYMMATGEGAASGEFDVSTRPMLQAVIDLISNKKPTRNVPPDMVYLLKGMGVWNQSMQFFDINPKVQRERRPQEPVFGEEELQYEMTEKGARLFKAVMLLNLMSGLQSNMREYTRIKMAASDDERLKRFAKPNPLLYAMGVDRAGYMKDPEQAMYRANKKLEQEFRESLKELK